MAKQENLAVEQTAPTTVAVEQTAEAQKSAAVTEQTTQARKKPSTKLPIPLTLKRLLPRILDNYNYLLSLSSIDDSEQRQFNLIPVYKQGRFPKILCVNQEAEGVDQNDISELKKDLSNTVQGISLIGDSKENRKQFGFGLTGSDTFLKKAQPQIISFVNEIISNCTANGFPKHRTNVISQTVCSIWRIDDVMYLELKFFCNPSKIGNVEYKELLSVRTLDARQFKEEHGGEKNGWEKTKQLFSIKSLINKEQLLKLLKEKNNTEASIEKEKIDEFKNVPMSYWYLPNPERRRTGFTFMSTDRKYPIIHSKKVPAYNAVRIRWDKEKKPDVYELLRMYKSQSENDDGTDKDPEYEPLNSSEEERSAFAIWGEKVSKAPSLKTVQGEDQSYYFEVPGRDFQIGFMKKEEFWPRSYHILAGHWDQFQTLIPFEENTQAEQKGIGQKIYDTTQEMDRVDKELDKEGVKECDYKEKLIAEMRALREDENTKDTVLQLQQKIMECLNKIVNGKLESVTPVKQHRSGKDEHVLLAWKIEAKYKEETFIRYLFVVIDNQSEWKIPFKKVIVTKGKKKTKEEDENKDSKDKKVIMTEGKEKTNEEDQNKDSRDKKVIETEGKEKTNEEDQKKDSKDMKEVECRNIISAYFVTKVYFEKMFQNLKYSYDLQCGKFRITSFSEFSKKQEDSKKESKKSESDEQKEAQNKKSKKPETDEQKEAQKKKSDEQKHAQIANPIAEKKESVLATWFSSHQNPVTPKKKLLFDSNNFKDYPLIEMLLYSQEFMAPLCVVTGNETSPTKMVKMIGMSKVLINAIRDKFSKKFPAKTANYINLAELEVNPENTESLRKRAAQRITEITGCEENKIGGFKDGNRKIKVTYYKVPETDIVMIFSETKTDQKEELTILFKTMNEMVSHIENEKADKF